MKAQLPPEARQQAPLPPCDREAMSPSTERERQVLLISELNHRVKNVLAVVRTLVRHSRAQAGSLDDFSRTLDQRIQALSSAQDLLVRRNWSPAPLRDLLATELEPYLVATDARITFDGPPVLLEPRAHTALALVIHELATNAAKYGALQAEPGRVEISWQHRGDHLHLVWRESGGPPVRSPRRRGFGSTVIERTIPYELGGTAAVRFSAGGVQAEIRIPGELIMSGSDETPEEMKKPRAHRLPKGLRLLVVEDNMILALDAEDMLSRNGAAQVEVISTCEEALRRLESERFDVALLDLKLARGDSLPVAVRLHELAIPFAFATGHGERTVLPPQFADRPVIGKPYSESYLIGRIAELLESGG